MEPFIKSKTYIFAIYNRTHKNEDKVSYNTTNIV